MKSLEPFLPDQLEQIEYDTEYLKLCQAEEERVHGKLFRNMVLEEADLPHMIIAGVRFENCRFWNCIFERGEFTDSVFQSCDFSGCSFNDSYFNRVLFSSCKGVGAKFPGSNLKNVKIYDSNFNYVNLDGSKLENIRSEQSSLKNSNMAQCRCRQVHWKEVDLTNASFFKTPLKGMDFTDSTIHGLVLSDDNSELMGACVDLFQAAELAKRMGLIIKDMEYHND